MAIDIHITEPTANVNMRTLANANGFTGHPLQRVTIYIDDGTYTYSNDPSVASVIRGSWPGGYVPRLIRFGSMYGAAGAGGTYGSGSINGQNGGAALDVRSGPIEFGELGGEMLGGGGGGGAGGNSEHAGGGGGGGGQGRNNAAAGAGYAPVGPGYGGSNGGAGSAAGAGYGGPGGSGPAIGIIGYDGDGLPIYGEEHLCVAGSGGAGGGWEQPGQNGTTGTEVASPAGNGGAAGAKIIGTVRRIRVGAVSAGIGTITANVSGVHALAAVTNSSIGNVAIAATGTVT